MPKITTIYNKKGHLRFSTFIFFILPNLASILLDDCHLGNITKLYLKSMAPNTLGNCSKGFAWQDLKSVALIVALDQGMWEQESCGSEMVLFHDFKSLLTCAQMQYCLLGLKNNNVVNFRCHHSQLLYHVCCLHVAQELYHANNTTAINTILLWHSLLMVQCLPHLITNPATSELLITGPILTAWQSLESKVPLQTALAYRPVKAERKLSMLLSCA